jgi:phospholipid transport system substrate-binding protein
MRKKILFIFFYIFINILALNSSNAYDSDPKKFIGEIVDEAKKILIAENNKKYKEEKLSEMALKTVDVKGIGFYTLGKYRKNLTDGQLEEYESLFEKYFLKSFTSRLSDYSDPKIDVLSAEVLNPKYTMVKSLLQGTDQKPEVEIDWRVYTKDPANPLIRDLIVEGLSLARTQKEEFASVLESNNGDINKLFTSLKEFINK